MNALVAANDRFALVEHHPYPHLLQSGDHADSVVIAQHTVNWPFEMRSHLRHCFESFIERAEGLAAVITSQDTEVVRYYIKKRNQAAHRILTYIRVHVADVEDGESIKKGREVRPLDEVVAYLYTLCIPVPSPIQPCQLQRVAYNGVDRIPVLNVKEVDATAKYALLIVLLDSEPLPCMHASEALLQFCKNVLLH